MSAAMPAAVTAFPLVTQLGALLSALFDGCRADSFVRVLAGRGPAAQQYRHRVSAGWSLLPPWLLRELAFEGVDEIRMPLVSVDQGGGLLDAPALWVEIALPPQFMSDAGGWGWRVPAELLDEATARLAKFELPVSVLVDGFDSLLAVWLLARPAKLDDPAVFGRVEQLQRSLAEALGGRVDDIAEALPSHSIRPPGVEPPSITLPACSVRRAALRLPGSRNHARGGQGEPVVLVHADLSARYTLDAIEAALTLRATNKAQKGRK